MLIAPLLCATARLAYLQMVHSRKSHMSHMSQVLRNNNKLISKNRVNIGSSSGGSRSKCLRDT